MRSLLHCFSDLRSLMERNEIFSADGFDSDEDANWSLSIGDSAKGFVPRVRAWEKAQSQSKRGETDRQRAVWTLVNSSFSSRRASTKTKK